MVYVFIQYMLGMLGFLPEASTRDNLEHGKKLLARCSHESIQQIHDWWQDPNMYYSFTSREGARWMSEHGGPPRFMRMVAESVPIVPKPITTDQINTSVRCYSCEKPFKSFVKPIDFCVYRCMCTQKVTHVGCFMGKTCAWCGLEYSKKIMEREKLIDL